MVYVLHWCGTPNFQLLKGSSGLWWGCRTTQVEAGDAQPEQGGPSSISPIQSRRVRVCVRVHIKTYTSSQMSANTRCYCC